ncbi:MAG: hypothetical protein KAR13_19045 [Desulfobulbaceae bacterium]|nr:hypothetical protein [Desulfobulbaceae bacterium]
MKYYETFHPNVQLDPILQELVPHLDLTARFYEVYAKWQLMTAIAPLPLFGGPRVEVEMIGTIVVTYNETGESPVKQLHDKSFSF